MMNSQSLALDYCSVIADSLDEYLVPRPQCIYQIPGFLQATF